MEKKGENNKVKLCKRCRKSSCTDLICTNCKVELINRYDSKLDWQTAFRIEHFQQSAMKYIDEDYQ